MIQGSKGILPPTIPDFSALRALEILKTFKIRSFFCKKWLLFHVLAGHKGAYSLLRASTTSQHDLLTLVSNLFNKAYLNNRYKI